MLKQVNSVMSGLYQHFLTLVLLTSAALLSTFLIYPPKLPVTSVDLRNAVDRMYMTLLPCLAYKVVYLHVYCGPLLPFVFWRPFVKVAQLSQRDRATHELLRFAKLRSGIFEPPFWEA